MSPSVRKVKLPHHRLRFLASKIPSFRRAPPPSQLSSNPITVVCISDTHNTQPSVPPGDLLLHAGDLSNWGTFAEIQAQLTWLSQQPHRHKVVIAGNHDLLLDADFRERHPGWWRQAQEAASSANEGFEMKRAMDLDWGDVVYLQNSFVALRFPGSPSERVIQIYGSPLTPQYGLSAFQYPGSTDVWTNRIPRATDILLTHGPLRCHLDGAKKSGCAFLAKEIVAVRPRLVVFGHIHVGYGKEEKTLDRFGKSYEATMGQWGAWKNLLAMMVGVVGSWVVPKSLRMKEEVTTFINAAVVQGWEEHVVKTEAVVVQI